MLGGYPEEAELQAITDWDWHDIRGCFEYIKERWWAADLGYWSVAENDKETVYNISTAGWSGNEDIIGAMKENTMLWSLSWYSSRRGGHYIFKVPKLK